MDKTKTNKTRFYWTKTRKQQLLYYKILFGAFFASTIVLGAIGTYTTKVMASDTSDVTVVRKEVVVVEPETVEQQIRRIAKEENFQWPDWLVKVSFCESRHNPFATNAKGNSPAGSVDRGLFMWNSYHHKEITDACAFSVDCSTREAIKLVLKGRQSEFICNKLIKK
jgi:hypothetical protein